MVMVQERKKRKGFPVSPRLLTPLFNYKRNFWRDFATCHVYVHPSRIHNLLRYGILIPPTGLRNRLVF
jgi:hypothetical protein